MRSDKAPSFQSPMAVDAAPAALKAIDADSAPLAQYAFDSEGQCDVKEKTTEAASAETSNVLSSGHKARIRRLNKSNRPAVSGTGQSAGQSAGSGLETQL